MDGCEACRRFREYETAYRLVVSQTVAPSVATAGESESGRSGLGGVNTGGTPMTGRMRRLVIIGISANGDGESKKLAMEAGMDYFITKPYTLSDLVLVIEQLR
jgi:CheY-like chemotaxis protein